MSRTNTEIQPSPGKTRQFSRLKAAYNLLLTAVVVCFTGLAVASEPRPPVTLDDMFLQVAHKAPGFAGMYRDGSTLVIRAVRTSAQDKKLKERRRKMRNAVLSVFGEALLADRPGIELVAADFAFDELALWYSKLLPIHRRKGIAYTDINERSNRLEIGYVPSDTSISKLRAFVVSAGIPEKMVQFVKSAYARQDTDLTDRLRPIDGGVQINVHGDALCTLGFNARLADGRDAFITNSHCTRVQGGVDPTVYWQHTTGSPFDMVGIEIGDPVFTASSSRCPQGRLCRYSDAAIAQYLPMPGVSSSLGELARVGTWGGLTISSNDPDYEIIAPPLFILSGEILMKLGRTSGKTAGVVDTTCGDANILDSNGNQTGNMLLCQFYLAANPSVGGGVTPISASGDSGGPVFKLLSAPNPTHEVGIYGLHWGTTGLGRAIFSPIVSVITELQDEVGSFVIR